MNNIVFFAGSEFNQILSIGIFSDCLFSFDKKRQYYILMFLYIDQL